MRRSLVTLGLCLSLAVSAYSRTERWTVSEANAWYAQQPWLVGSNYIPSSAVNQLEMWQADSFDPKRIDRELGWAEELGMNTMRVFLHDLLWQQDPAGFKSRIETFLSIAAKHGIRPMFVLFDSSWDPSPHVGRQPPPRPGVHNSRWVQSPGAAALSDPRQYPRLAGYVTGVIGAFATDPRILAWDLWNEPFSVADVDPYRTLEPANKRELVHALLPQVFDWARQANPSQPLTSGLPRSPGSEQLSADERMQLDLSDVVSFHMYSDAGFRSLALWLQSFQRPLLCTEFMARSSGSTFKGTLPVAKAMRIAAYNWGLVNGKTQTNLPWESWGRSRFNHSTRLWLHDIFYADGSPYLKAETDLIRSLTGAGAPTTSH
jgi:hypothetical protein